MSHKFWKSGHYKTFVFDEATFPFKDHSFGFYCPPRLESSPAIPPSLPCIPIIPHQAKQLSSASTLPITTASPTIPSSTPTQIPSSSTVLSSPLPPSPYNPSPMLPSLSSSPTPSHRAPSDVPILIPIADLETVPPSVPTVNTHPMVTRSKAGIVKPRVFVASMEPRSVK
ncbi:proline-rich receptor-like protein kinase PERK2 [Arachis stenosperma]|uniref:proline-rich receptor-like protein kinase PERK2 n=1 Tax=Arachis stenosperma TaxID=217475 RepID=UPI0025ABF11C|nr:proline-rich receptor-like protein kinase PERK2 [Arachis stenosperma]